MDRKLNGKIIGNCHAPSFYFCGGFMGAYYVKIVREPVSKLASSGCYVENGLKGVKVEAG